MATPENPYDLSELLTLGGGLGDQEQALQAQLAAAQRLRDRTAYRPANHPGAALGGLIANVIGGYRAGNIEEQAYQGQGALQARKQKILGMLPGLEMPAGSPGAPQRQRALGRALAGFGSPSLAPVAETYEKSAGALEKEDLQHQRLVNSLLQTGMKLEQARELADRAFYADAYNNVTGDRNYSGVVKRRNPDGTLTIIPQGEAKPPGAGGAGGSGRDIVVLTGEGGLKYRYNKMTKEIEPILAPEGAPGQVAGEEPQPLVGGAPTDVQKLATDLQFVAKMPDDLALLQKYAGEDVPGMGPLAGRLPDWATSAEGNEARQAAMRLINALIYMQSGKQINETEARRILVAEGLGPTAPADAFASGVKALEKKIRAAANTFVNSRPRGVVDLARKQGVLKPIEPLLDRPAAPPPRPARALPGAAKASLGPPPQSGPERQAWIKAAHAAGMSRDEIKAALAGGR